MEKMRKKLKKALRSLDPKQLEAVALKGGGTGMDISFANAAAQPFLNQLPQQIHDLQAQAAEKMERAKQLTDRFALEMLQKMMEAGPPEVKFADAYTKTRKGRKLYMLVSFSASSKIEKLVSTAKKMAGEALDAGKPFFDAGLGAIPTGDWSEQALDTLSGMVASIGQPKPLLGKYGRLCGYELDSKNNKISIYIMVSFQIRRPNCDVQVSVPFSLFKIPYLVDVNVRMEVSPLSHVVAGYLRCSIGPRRFRKSFPDEQGRQVFRIPFGDALDQVQDVRDTVDELRDNAKPKNSVQNVIGWGKQAIAKAKDNFQNAIGQPGKQANGIVDWGKQAIAKAKDAFQNTIGQTGKQANGIVANVKDKFHGSKFPKDPFKVVSDWGKNKLKSVQNTIGQAGKQANDMAAKTKDMAAKTKDKFHSSKGFKHPFKLPKFDSYKR
jgi:cell division septum initiation protein DivIVA